MARLPRLTLAGQTHLVLLHGRAGLPMFVDDEDRRRYALALLDASREHAVAVHAYALLDDEVLLLATEPEAGALGRFMQAVARRYVRPFNRRHGRSGPLGEGRFRSAVLEPASFLHECTLMIEQAPVRAGLVTQTADWPWSSAAHHAGGRADSIVTDHEAHWQLGNTPFERQARHAGDSAVPLADVRVEALRSAAHHGWPLGRPAFVAALAAQADRPVAPRPRGRPRRTETGRIPG